MRVSRSFVQRAALTLSIWAAVFALSRNEAFAQSTAVPSLQIADGSAVTPANAWTYFSPLTGVSPSRSADPLIERTASALGDDPLRIYTFVRNQIEVVPMFGVQKGARGCLIDKACTPFDQAHLLAELLRAADAQNPNISLSTAYEFREATLTLAQMTDWFGVSNQSALNEVLADGGTPFSVAGSNYTVLHLVVRITIGPTTYRLDPSFKSHTTRTGLSNLDTAMGFSAPTFMSSALSGASSSTSGAPQVATFNRGNVRTILQN